MKIVIGIILVGIGIVIGLLTAKFDKEDTKERPKYIPSKDDVLNVIRMVIATYG